MRKEITDTPERPVDWVNPLIDTGKPRVRWIFSASACRPFGMVRLSADTDPVGCWGSGYRYFSDTIHAFSHVHAWQLSGIPVMPTNEACTAAVRIPQLGSAFSHDRETVRPGYYSVMLDTYGIRAELTATERVGFHRYTFPATEACSVRFDLGAELGPCQMSDAMVRAIAPDELEGFVENAPTGRRPKPCRIYFVVCFDQPAAAFGGWQNDTFIPQADRISGKNCGAFVNFAGRGGLVLRMKVGLSYVSIEQARGNLQSEVPHWDFDRVRQETEDVWNDWLGRIQVEGGSATDRTKFYTDIWRSLQGGFLTSDVDGCYCDNTGPKAVIRQIPIAGNGRPLYRRLEADVLWGAHWGQSLLWGMAYPEIVNDWCNTLVGYYKDGGLIPRGPSGGNYTFVMISSHSTAFITAAYMKGIRSFDVEAAYAGMRKNAFPGGLMSKAGYEHHTCLGGGIEDYIERGYIPEGRNVPGTLHVDGAAQTMEYSYDDWCLAQMARVLGKEADHRYFLERSMNYRNIYNAASGFMHPRNQDGTWLSPFDPLSLKGWCEGNSWQYTFYVPHDVEGLIKLIGGRKAFERKLNDAFEAAVPMDFYAPKPDLRRDAAYINYGNEPGRFVAHLFNHCGSPWLAQKWTRQVKQRTFSSVEPTGFCEDDDNGQAAATSALLALGLFDVRGGAAREPVYEITSPVFDRIVILLDRRYYPGNQFVIEARNNTPENIYIQSAVLDGRQLDTPWFPHRQLVSGGVLVLDLGPEPNKEWGARPEHAPPSMSTDDDAR